MTLSDIKGECDDIEGDSPIMHTDASSVHNKSADIDGDLLGVSLNDECNDPSFNTTAIMEAGPVIQLLQ